MLNISNHPVAKWSSCQVAAAYDLDPGRSLTDIPFPHVLPTATTGDVTGMAQRLAAGIVTEYGTEGIALVQGEFSLTFELSRMLLAIGWQVVVATSERKTVDLGGGTKTTVFEFVQFRALRG